MKRPRLISALKGTWPIANWLAQAEIQRWKEAGCPVPPPGAIKRATIIEYGRAFGLTTLIETGTHRGDTVAAVRGVFSRIISIELDESLWNKACERFKKCADVEIIRGDSSNVLPALLAKTQTPCLFWLDGHYSGGDTARGKIDSPVRMELEAILQAPYDHVILIDDARLFDGTAGYPTPQELQKMLAQHRPNWSIRTEHDIIRIHRP